MTFKSFMISFGAFISVTALLYAIGHLFSIHWLMFQYELKNDYAGFLLSFSSFTPVLFGLVAAFLAEKVFISKFRH